MLSCRICDSKSVSVAGGGGSRNSVFRCRNPRCRVEYVEVLSITTALAGLPRKALAGKVPVVRRADDYLDLE